MIIEGESIDPPKKLSTKFTFHEEGKEEKVG
jgi:hypothetical protein